MTWEELFASKKYVGGEIETYEGDLAFCGPITDILMSDGKITFKLSWLAERKRRADEWSLAEQPAEIILTCGASDLQGSRSGGGEMRFDMPGLGWGVLRPAGKIHLHPDNVKGLHIKKEEGSRCS